MPKILLVEDKDSLRQMLVTALGRTGHHVKAADSQKAAELLRKRPFHLIVSDLRLPHVSGIELLKIQKDVDANVPVLIMTAYGTIVRLAR